MPLTAATNSIKREGLSLVFCCLLVACAPASKVTSIGADGYTVSGSSIHSEDRAREQAFDEAQRFCAKQGGAFLLKRHAASQYVDHSGNTVFHHYVIFRCPDTPRPP